MYDVAMYVFMYVYYICIYVTCLKWLITFCRYYIEYLECF